MTKVADLERRCRRWTRCSLVAAATLAILSLPADQLPLAWLLALLLPAATLAHSLAFGQRVLPRLLLAVPLQVASCAIAYDAAGPLLRPAALAGTILPPLAFVAVRRNGDAALGLFLAFCVLLVGTILGRPSAWLLPGFVFAATLQLRCETRLRALRATARRQPSVVRGAGIGGGAWLGVTCLCAALAVDRTLALVPALTGARLSSAPASTPRGPARTGLSDTFELGSGGSILELRGDLLVTVRSGDHDRLPDDLYLRQGFFQEPGMVSWNVGTLEPERRDASAADWRLHLPLPGAPLRRLEVERHPGSRNAVFVVPGTCSILGVPDLFGDAGREWFRQHRDGRVDDYELLCQQLPPPPDDLPVDDRWSGLGLLDLPPQIDRALFEPLLTEFAPGGSARQCAAAIADGLRRRCRYERREPYGPYPHSLGNFLHGERIGFCMHFASAAAILLRMVGVPCRIGVGLYGGTRQADGSIDFGSQHSHAWVEIPITGRGWVVFDPTPPAERGTPTRNAGADAAAGDAQGDGQPGWRDRLLAGLLALAEGPWPWLAALLLLLLPLLHGRRHARGGAPVAAAPGARPARRWLLRILTALAERGHRRPPGATLEQFAHRLAAPGGEVPEALRLAFATYQDVRFGGRPWDHAREQCMERGVAAARELPPSTAAPAD